MTDEHEPRSFKAHVQLRNKVEELITTVCYDLSIFLIEKNRSYGNSVVEPISIFSSLLPFDQINVRIDDKLNRLIKGHELQGEDTIKDLIGYLILREVLLRYSREAD
jgi:hypothetical protein